VHVWLLFLVLAALTQLPYLRAALEPPPGRAFVGTFHWVDDYYNYLSFVRQAEEGRFVFDSAIYLPPHRPVLVNLEWWTVGRLSAALGGHPLLAYRLFGLAAMLALLFGIDRWLSGCGLPREHRLPALALVTTGGGLGGWLFEFSDLPASRCVDLATGMFPFVEALANPHFVAGTALVLWALWFLAAQGPRGLGPGLTLGTVLGLVRPYDLANLGVIRGLGALLTCRPREALTRLLPLLALVPVIVYNLWVFFRNPAFIYSQTRYAFPAHVDFLLALGPALGLSLFSIFRRPAEAPARALTIHLACWVALGVSIILARPGQFLSQHLTGLGAPILILSALGLSRFRPAATWLAVVALGFTSVVAVRIVLTSDPAWYAAAERFEAGRVLRSSCRRGDVFLGPPDVGLYALGLSSCKTVLSHAWSPGFAERLEKARGFYGAFEPPARARWLDELCVTHVALPGDAGPVPSAWLGASTRFRRLAHLDGAAGGVSLYAREPEDRCRTR
jgi:hypothetical protein